MKKSSRAAAALIALCSGAAAGAELTVEVQGVNPGKGTLVIAVYDREESWLRKPFAATKLEANAANVVAAFKDLPEGAYAVSLYHDENGNGRLDSNAMRIPVEPYAFSNNATGLFGPASFADARFGLPASGARIIVQLQN